MQNLQVTSAKARQKKMSCSPLATGSSLASTTWLAPDRWHVLCTLFGANPFLYQESIPLWEQHGVTAITHHVVASQKRRMT
jgi:hypothetical protein